MSVFLAQIVRCGPGENTSMHSCVLTLVSRRFVPRDSEAGSSERSEIARDGFFVGRPHDVCVEGAYAYLISNNFQALLILLN